MDLREIKPQGWEQLLQPMPMMMRPTFIPSVTEDKPDEPYQPPSRKGVAGGQKVKAEPKKKKSKGLTQRQQDALRRHSAHHTKKHMAMMSNAMKDGKTFQQAHKMAMESVGK